MTSQPSRCVRIVHETNPTKYFPALFELHEQGRIEIVGAHRYSCFKEWFRVWLRERKPFWPRTVQFLRDVRFRFQLPFIKEELIILGFAPWDWRICIYGLLARNNTLIYHTSWPNWSPRETPRRYGPLTPALRRLWLRFLEHRNVHIVAVLDATSVDLLHRHSLMSTVIPHAVPESFYTARQARCDDSQSPLRLIYVGELSTKKGIHQLVSLMDSMPNEQMTLTIVGDGPLRERCIEAESADPRVRYAGPILDRTRLAETMASHDLLILLSQHESGWQELFGIVIAEAVAAGLGVIASDHIGPRSMLGAASLGNLFEDNDANGVQKLIARLSGDRAELDRFKTAHSHISEELRLSSVADAWFDLVSQVARKGPSSYDR